MGYLAIAIFLVGFMARVWKYATTPVPLKIPLTPAPVGTTGVIYRTAQEIKHTRLFFKSFVRAAIISVKKFVMGLITFSPQVMLGDIIFKIKRTKHVGAVV